MATVFQQTAYETEKKPRQTIKNRQMVTASKFPFSLDGSLCSTEIYSSLHISEIITFPGICLPGALKWLYPTHRAWAVILTLPRRRAFTRHR